MLGPVLPTPLPLRPVCCCCAQGGLSRVRANLQSRVKKGALSAVASEQALSLLKGELTYDQFKVG